LGDPEGGTVDFKINLNVIRNLNIEVKRIVEGNVLEDLRKSIQGSDLIVDAIFGIGISREVTGLYRKAIEIINESGKPVISVDIPSGLNGDTGEVMGVSVNADRTITFHRVKNGLVNAVEYTGEVIVEKIGIPEKGYGYNQNIRE
ncbi:MAG: NAD(P)H-hydrate epimerase, partial [Gudongella sp.]|nr:NAD(P)H-hydrate epimerase [Gudongella sp.]